MTNNTTSSALQKARELLEILRDSISELERLYEENERLKKERDEARKAIERANAKLIDIGNMFYGQNMGVTNWHLNGDVEPIDNFFDANDWEPEPINTTSAKMKKPFDTSEWFDGEICNCKCYQTATEQ